MNRSRFLIVFLALFLMFISISHHRAIAETFNVSITYSPPAGYQNLFGCADHYGHPDLYLYSAAGENYGFTGSYSGFTLASGQTYSGTYESNNNPPYFAFRGYLWANLNGDGMQFSTVGPYSYDTGNGTYVGPGPIELSKTGTTNGVLWASTIIDANWNCDGPIGPALQVGTWSAWPAAQYYAYARGSDTSVSVIDVSTDTVVDTIPIDGKIWYLAISTDGRKLYVLVEPTGGTDKADHLQVIDTYSHAVQANIKLIGNRASVTISPDGKKTYVSSGYCNPAYNYISVIDNDTYAVLDPIPVASSAWNTVISADGTKLFYGSTCGGTYVGVIDLLSGNNIKNISVPGIEWLTLNPSGTKLYYSTGWGTLFGSIDTSNYNIINTTYTGGDTDGSAITPDGTKLYVTVGSNYQIWVVNTADFTHKTTIQIDEWGNHAAVSPDGRKVYVNGWNNVHVIDTATDTLIKEIPAKPDNIVFGPKPGSPNSPPVLNPIGPQNVLEGATLQFTISATDPDGNTLTYSASNLPTGATFDPATRTFSWTPNYNQAGNYLVGFNVTDNGIPPLSSSEQITITVSNVNRPPVLSPIGNKTVNEGELLKFTITATDPDGDTLTYSAGNLPRGATFNPDTHTFSWTPDYTQAGVYSGIEFTVTDNGSPNELAVETISITVGNVNRPPVFTPVGTQQTMENQLLKFYVTATDPDGDAIIFSTDSLPSGAAFDAGSRLFSWKPSYVQSGTYVITFHATDNGSSPMTGNLDVTIVVGDVPTPSELADQMVQMVVNLKLQQSVENSYMANLKKVSPFVEQGQTTPAINQLDAFIKKIVTDISKGNISQAAGNNLINKANNLINILKS